MVKTPEPARPMSKPPGSIKKPSDATLVVKPVTTPLTPEPIRPKTKPPSFKKAPSQIDNIQPVYINSPVKPPERPQPARPLSKPPQGRSSLNLRRESETPPTRPAGIASRSKSFSAASSTPSPTDDISPTKRPPVPPRPSLVQVSGQQPPPELPKKKKKWLRRVSVAAIGGNKESPETVQQISPTNDPFPHGVALQPVPDVCTTPTQERRFVLGGY